MPNSVVPNKFPTIPPGDFRLACVGEAPGGDEEVALEPFVGVSGRFLRAILGNTGISTQQIFFGNICQVRPPSNDIERFDYHGPEIQSGLERLRSDLSDFRPHCVLLLGRSPFRGFHGDLCYQSKKGYIVPLSDWRGSIRQSPVFGYKTVSAYHPSYILRAYKENPLFRFDVARGVRQSYFPEVRGLHRQKLLRPDVGQAIEYLRWFQETRSLFTWDIEGYADDVGITMFSVAKSPTDAIVIPFWLDGKNYWTEEEEVLIWQTLAEVLADPSVPKEAHFGFYESFVSAWRHRMVINNYAHDTGFSHWECYPEAGGDGDSDDTGKKKVQGLGRDLGTCTSIYTEHPYYKHGRLSSSSEGKLDYSATDSLVTGEVGIETRKQLAKYPKSYEHYRFNIRLIPAYNYIMLRGCRLDLDRTKTLATEVMAEINSLQQSIDEQILGEAVAADVVTRKRKSDPYHFNVDSGNQLRWLLFEHLKLKPQARKVTETGKPQTDEAVLLHHWTKTQSPLLRLIIRLVRKRTRLGDIHKLVPDSDGRIRSSIDPIGTNTGRTSSRESNALRLTPEGWENTGTNVQQVTKDLRVTFIPDSPDFIFWQVDLAGADGWTVGADLASLGRPCMLDDFYAGVKPALVLNLMLNEHEAGRDPGTINRLDRAQIKALCKVIKADYDAHEGEKLPDGRPYDWKYFVCKQTAHATNYGAEPDKIAEVTFKKSDGAIALTKTQAALYQGFYKLRYEPAHRNEAIRKRLCEFGYLTAACGIRRQFFNIRNRYDIDDSIVREAAAFEPQANTTWATNAALQQLWYDPQNRQSSGALHVEPLLQIHDALAGQMRERDREWGQERLKGWFNNPLTICGIKLNIPAEGKYGENWKNTKHQFL